MSAPFTAGCSIDYAYPSGSPDTYEGSLRVVDLSGIYSVYDLAVGDVVFLDMIASTSAPGTVGRYVVASVGTITPPAALVSLRWAGAFNPVEPNEAAGLPGYVSRPSAKNGLVWHPMPAQVNVPEYLIAGARNVESFAVLENMAKGDQVRQKRTFTSAGETLVVGDVVGLDAAGRVYKANPADPAKMPAAGVVVAVTTTAGDYEVQTAGELTVAGATLTPGKFVWVGPAGLTQNMADVPANGVLQQAGLALTPTNLTLALPGLVVTK